MCLLQVILYLHTRRQLFTSQAVINGNLISRPRTKITRRGKRADDLLSSRKGFIWQRSFRQWNHFFLRLYVYECAVGKAHF